MEGPISTDFLEKKWLNNASYCKIIYQSSPYLLNDPPILGHAYGNDQSHVRGAFNKFPDIFVEVFKIVVEEVATPFPGLLHYPWYVPYIADC